MECNVMYYNIIIIIIYNIPRCILYWGTVVKPWLDSTSVHPLSILLFCHGEAREKRHALDRQQSTTAGNPHK